MIWLSKRYRKWSSEKRILSGIQLEIGSLNYCHLFFPIIYAARLQRVGEKEKTFSLYSKLRLNSLIYKELIFKRIYSITLEIYNRAAILVLISESHS